MKIIYIILFLTLSAHSYAEDGVWLGSDKSVWSETKYRKVKNDFGGFLLVTSDLNWQQKWETLPETVPYFNVAKSVHIGEKIVILTFFTNPMTNKTNEAHVLCSIKVTRPDNTASVNYKDISCIKGKLQGSPDYIYLSPAIINYSGEVSDPLGVWVVEVAINDVLRETVLNLRTSFRLEP